MAYHPISIQDRPRYLTCAFVTGILSLVMATLGHFRVAFLGEFPIKPVNIQPGTPISTDMSRIYLLRESMQKDALFKVGTERKRLGKSRNFNNRKINSATS